MEAGDGALTLRGAPAASEGAHRLPALPPRGIRRSARFRPERESGTLQLMNMGGPACPPGNRWHQVEAPNPSAPSSFRPDWPSRKGSLPEWGETAWQAPVGTTRARSRPCRDVPWSFLLISEASAGGGHLFAKAIDVTLLRSKYGDTAEFVPLCERKQP